MAGVGQGRRSVDGGVMPAEQRALTSGVLSKMARFGDEPENTI